MDKLEFTNKYNNISVKLDEKKAELTIGFKKYKDIELDYYKENEYLAIEISGLDQDNKECSLSFMLDMSIDDLNKLDKKAVCINDKILQNDTYFYDEAKDRKVNVDNNFEFSMIELSPSYYVQKIDNKKFVFRIFIPSKYIFTYFLCDLSER